MAGRQARSIRQTAPDCGRKARVYSRWHASEPTTLMTASLATIPSTIPAVPLCLYRRHQYHQNIDVAKAVANEMRPAATAACPCPSTPGTTAPGAVASALVEASQSRDSERAHAELGRGLMPLAGWRFVRGVGAWPLFTRRSAAADRHRHFLIHPPIAPHRTATAIVTLLESLPCLAVPSPSPLTGDPSTTAPEGLP